jgi:hypothetical protein
LCEHEHWTGLGGEKTEKKVEERGRGKRQGNKDREKDNAETQRARRGAERWWTGWRYWRWLSEIVEELEDGVGGAVDCSGGAETVADFG